MMSTHKELIARLARVDLLILEHLGAPSQFVLSHAGRVASLVNGKRQLRRARVCLWMQESLQR
jgi:hypothetical protein